jgi:hypothetical protein
LAVGLADPNFPAIDYRREAGGQPAPVLQGLGIRIQHLVVGYRDWGVNQSRRADPHLLRSWGRCLVDPARNALRPFGAALERGVRKERRAIPDSGDWTTAPGTLRAKYEIGDVPPPAGSTLRHGADRHRNRSNLVFSDGAH